MSIETKTRIVVLWTIASVIALLFLTGCDGGDDKKRSSQYYAHIESTSGVVHIYHNDDDMGYFDTPCDYVIDRPGGNTVIVYAPENELVFMDIYADNECVDAVWGSYVWCTIIIK